MFLVIQSLLRCHFYSTQRLEHFENLEKVDPNFLSLSGKNQVFIFYCMVLQQKIPKVSIRKFLK